MSYSKKSFQAEGQESAGGALPPSLSGSVAGSTMTFWPVAENAPDDAVLDIREVDPPRHGRLKQNPDGTLTYAPDSGFIGVDRFGYTLVDAEGNLYPASVTVMVEHDDAGGEPVPASAILPSAEPPIEAKTPHPETAAESAAETDPGEAEAGPDAGVGEGGGIVAYSDGKHGTVSRDAEGALVYTPKGGFVGLDGFTYTVRDEEGRETTASVTVRIEPGGAYSVIQHEPVNGSR